MPTKTELDAIVTNAMPHGNVAFSVTDQPDGLTTDRFKATQRAEKRRDRKSRAALKRERLERKKELGKDSPMTVDEFEAAIDFVEDEFGIILNSNHGGFSVRPKVSQRDLYALAARVTETEFWQSAVCRGWGSAWRSLMTAPDANTSTMPRSISQC